MKCKVCNPIKIIIMADNIFDEIVIDSGISGGLTAKELCEKVLKTIILERCRNIEQLKII